MIRVRALATGVAGGPWYNNYFFDGTGTDAQAAYDKVVDVWSTLVDSLSQQVQVQVEPLVYTIAPTTGNVSGVTGVTPDPTPLNGTSTADLLPTATALCVNLRTNQFSTGREIRGRSFISGLTVADNEDGVPRDGVPAAYAALYTSALVGGGVPLVVWSRKNAVAYPVTAVTAFAQWATLRSRRD